MTEDSKSGRDHLRRANVMGDKVYLRPMEREDINDDYLDWVNDSNLSKFILATRFPVSHDEAIDYYENSKPPAAVYFAVCDIETGTHIGNARLSLIDWTSRQCRYGRIIGHNDFRGKGYGSDALIQLLRFGFHSLGMNRIWSSAVVENEESLASNDKVGMTREGILREYVYAGGKFHNTVVLAMLRKDFDQLHGDPDQWRSYEMQRRKEIQQRRQEQNQG